MIASHMDKRAQLSQFLKSCRARVTPAEVGLTEFGRRRTPGLRREEVATISGVSVTWYMWLEQGRSVRVSSSVLERISRALRLSSEEREYLFELVHNRPPPLLPHHKDEVGAAVHHMLQSLSVPALIMTFRWDMVERNDLVREVFRDYGSPGSKDRNLLRILFTNPLYRKDQDAFEAMARRVVAKVKLDYSQVANDPEFEALIAELKGSCKTFSRLWKSPEVTARSEGVHTVRHRAVGRMSFEHTSYVPEGYPSLRVLIFSPNDEESAGKLRLLTDRLRSDANGESATVADPKMH